jgi:hypothetical protein
MHGIPQRAVQRGLKTLPRDERYHPVTANE